MIFISIYFPPSFFFVLFSFVSRIRNGNSIQTWIVLRCDTRKGRHDGYPSRSQLFLWVEYKREGCSGWRGVWADQSILNLFFSFSLWRWLSSNTNSVHIYSTYIYILCLQRERDRKLAGRIPFFFSRYWCVCVIFHARRRAEEKHKKKKNDNCSSSSSSSCIPERFITQPCGGGGCVFERYTFLRGKDKRNPRPIRGKAREKENNH